MTPDETPDRWDGLRAAIDETSHLRGEWRCWNGWGPVIGTEDVMAVHRLGPRGSEGGLRGYTLEHDGDLYATRTDAEFVALACEAAADLLAERDAAVSRADTAEALLRVALDGLHALGVSTSLSPEEPA